MIKRRAPIADAATVHRRLLTLLGLLVLACVGATSPAGGATGTTTIGAEVPSAAHLDTTGCRSDGALELGNLAVSTFALGGTCTIDFGSSNDSSTLRMWQHDEEGSAFEQLSGAATPLRGATYWWAVAASSPGTAWVGGAGGPGEPSARLERTDDGGLTWEQQATCNGQHPRSIEAMSDSMAVLITPVAICRTTTSGSGAGSWVTSFTAPTGSLFDIEMLDATTGWAGGSGAIYSTTNGTDWSLQYTDPVLTRITGISSHSSGLVVAVGSRSASANSDFGVLVSTDFGATWTRTLLGSTVGPDNSGVYGALAVNATTLIVSLPYAGVWRSTDAGDTWTSQPIAYFSREPFVRSDGVIFAATGGDAVSRSADDGASWTTVPLGTGISGFNAGIAGAGLNDLWVVGHADRRLRSADAGSTWSSSSPPRPHLRAIAAWDEDRWMTAGDGGASLRTVDGGTTLTAALLGTSQTITAGVAMPHGVGVLVGDSDTVLRTTDHGASWQPVTSPLPGTHWSEITKDDDDKLWAAGNLGRVMSSKDGGTTWTSETAVPGAPPITSLSVWRDVAWVGSTAGQVWRTPTSGALAWTAIPTGRATTILGLWAIDATTAVAQSGYDAGADNSHASRTTDSGASWTSSTLPAKHVVELAFDDSHRHGWLTSYGVVIPSRDRGLTWGTPEWGGSDYNRRVAAVGPSRLIVAGDAYNIWRSSPAAAYPDGMGGAGSGFGACLETATGTSSTPWTPAGPGGCTEGATGVWSAVAATALGSTAAVAHAGIGSSASLELRFAARTAPGQDSGDYTAEIVIEAVSPGV